MVVLPFGSAQLSTKTLPDPKRTRHLARRPNQKDQILLYQELGYSGRKIQILLDQELGYSGPGEAQPKIGDLAYTLLEILGE
jgi:hypothetical protein